MDFLACAGSGTNLAFYTYTQIPAYLRTCVGNQSESSTDGGETDDNILAGDWASDHALHKDGGVLEIVATVFLHCRRRDEDYVLVSFI